MSRYSKLILIGAILLVLGVTLVVTSYFKIYDTVEAIFPSARVLPIQANSSSDFFINLYPFLEVPLPKTQRVLVVVTGSQELQDVLNSTLNYNSTMKDGQNITISLVSGNQTMFATERSGPTIAFDEPIAPHLFDIPDDWPPWFHVRVTNPESYPVFWVVTIVTYRQIVNDSWLAVSLVGIIPIVLGSILVGVAGYRRKRINNEV